MAQVDAEQRHTRGPGQFRGAQQGAVPADHQHHLGAVGGRGRDRHDIGAHGAEVGRLGFQHPDVHAR